MFLVFEIRMHAAVERAVSNHSAQCGQRQVFTTSPFMCMGSALHSVALVRLPSIL